MSARTPFIPPGSRPASRVSHKNDQSANSAMQAATGQFHPDLNNPLHRADASSKPQSIQKSSGGMAQTSLAVNNASKPLNLNGFLKKPGSNHASSPSKQGNLARSRPSLDSSIVENSLAGRENTRNNPLSLVAPVPRAPTRSIPLSNSPERSYKPSTTLSTSHQPASDSEAFKLNLSLSKGGPPQRIPAEENKSLAGLIPRNRSKRVRPDEDEEQDSDLLYLGTVGGGGAPASGKRYRAETQQVDSPAEAGYMRHSFSPQPFSSPVAPSSGSDQPASPQAPNAYNHDAHSGVSLPDQSQIRPPVPDGGSLEKLLGYPADAYVEDHLDHYQQLASRWQECTIEEWMKGADVAEIMGKYAKVLDFVKKHMELKLKVFASFDAKVDNHKSVLRERAKLLESGRQNLVSNGHSLLGGGAVTI
ncbi:hypothetical protein V5O48_003028 [Marasmius crinis-equi]|uniref:Extracellular mutant protein 11 C-terminal domain-containing protein n=1 Tax=Marasmius crinis-equi TaxID=585013 RepID=A0ABR3FU34_9AGAR